jgi:hypothetical protein
MPFGAGWAADGFWLLSTARVKRMGVRLPNWEQMKERGRFELFLGAAQTAAFQQACKGSLASFASLDDLVPPLRAAAAGL